MTTSSTARVSALGAASEKLLVFAHAPRSSFSAYPTSHSKHVMPTSSHATHPSSHNPSNIETLNANVSWCTPRVAYISGRSPLTSRTRVPSSPWTPSPPNSASRAACHASAEDDASSAYATFVSLAFASAAAVSSAVASLSAVARAASAASTAAVTSASRAVAAAVAAASAGVDASASANLKRSRCP
eukprot:31010-Pelagococcus_subviridis.AAC.6